MTDQQPATSNTQAVEGTYQPPLKKPEVVLGFKVAVVEEKYNARYVGVYDPNASGQSIAVFWTDNPDRSLGHDNYFGLFIRHGLDGEPGLPYITSAAKLRDIEFPAIEITAGEFLVSRGRHDYVTHPCGAMLDGGGAGYHRYNPNFPPTHIMRVIDGYEVFEPLVIDLGAVKDVTDEKRGETITQLAGPA
ncbi:hypothetical protein BAJUN_00280 [Bajunvirus bajun]|uniref:Uncharacterized protein n=1 Tax=Brevundimonas phage vB_BgoS-Bajun TaxID=2948594 RepID=A0A9E7SRI6_9CAUD|nr:hypothetical protein BAJUN_00280 [Brevundimonas phage vB_BgoS-Bajun]